VIFGTSGFGDVRRRRCQDNRKLAFCIWPASVAAAAVAVASALRIQQRTAHVAAYVRVSAISVRVFRLRLPHEVGLPHISERDDAGVSGSA